MAGFLLDYVLGPTVEGKRQKKAISSDTELTESPCSGVLYKLKQQKSALSSRSFVERFFWVDDHNYCLRYASSRNKNLMKGVHFEDIINVKPTNHPKFFVVYGRIKKLTLRAPSAEACVKWVSKLSHSLKTFQDLQKSKGQPGDGQELSTAYCIPLNLQNVTPNMLKDEDDSTNITVTSTSIKYSKKHINDVIQQTPRGAKVEPGVNVGSKQKCNSSTVKIRRMGWNEAFAKRASKRLYTGRKQRSNASGLSSSRISENGKKMVQNVAKDDEEEENGRIDIVVVEHEAAALARRRKRWNGQAATEAKTVKCKLSSKNSRGSNMAACPTANAGSSAPIHSD